MDLFLCYAIFHQTWRIGFWTQVCLFWSKPAHGTLDFKTKKHSLIGKKNNAQIQDLKWNGKKVIDIYCQDEQIYNMQLIQTLTSTSIFTKELLKPTLIYSDIRKTPFTYIYAKLCYCMFAKHQQTHREKNYVVSKIPKLWICKSARTALNIPENNRHEPVCTSLLLSL